MKTIKILGTGCPNCVTTEKIVTEVVKELNLNAEILKVTDIQEIMMYDILSTPAVVIDEKVVVKGRIPSTSEMKEILNEESCCSSSNDPCCDSVDATSSDSCCDTSTNCC